MKGREGEVDEMDLIIREISELKTEGKEDKERDKERFKGGLKQIREEIEKMKIK